MKKLLLIAISILSLTPTIVHTQIDQRCWIKEDCLEARKDIFDVPPPTNDEELSKVFRQDDFTAELCGGKKDAAGAEIGFCLPTSAATTKISIGGETRFEGLAQFIAFIYQYGMSVAALLAILVIIFAGVQWTISGGNSETISSAQRKIYGAVIGLVILAAAYTILYTVNPYLVNLRPPNIWMINTQTLAAPTCGEVNSLISKNPSNKTGEVLSKEDKQTRFSAVAEWVSPTSTNPITGGCGNDYFVQRTGALTCSGMACETGSVCFNKDGTGNKCFEATIGGTVRSTSAESVLLDAAGGLVRTVFGEGWIFPWLSNGSTKELEIYIVCNNGTHGQIDITYPVDPGNPSNIRPNQEQVYAVAATKAEITEQWENYCKNETGTKGFVLAAEFNESGDGAGLEEHFLGRSLTTNTGANLVFEAFDLMNSSNDWDKCIFRNAPSQHFFTKDELIQGITLNINAKNIADIDDGDEDVVTKKIYYAGNRVTGVAGINAGTEDCK
jgi:hypothetical protein